MRVTLTVLGAVLGLLQNSALVPESRPDSWWMNRHNAMVEAAQQGDSRLVFVGDSITHAFGGVPDTNEDFHNRGADTWDYFFGEDKPLNLGISGDRTQHVLWRLDHSELGKNRPKVAVVMIGTNNLASNTPAEITEGVEAVCSKIQSLTPSTKVLLLGIFPRDKANSQNRKSIAAINKDLEEWAPHHRIKFLDIGYAFLDSAGEIPTDVMPDLLHPFAFGYRKWAMAMEPTLAQLMHRRPKTKLDPTNSAVVPVTQDRDYRTYDWKTRFALTKQYPKDHACRLAFIGDSINHFYGGPPLDRGLKQPTPVWQKYYGNRDAVDLGFGWDRTENVIWRLEQGELDNMPLEAVSLMIGTNNLFINTPEQIRDGVQAIIDKIHEQKPHCKILLLAVFPRGEKPADAGRLEATKLNRLLEPLGHQRNVTFMDIGSVFLEPDGTILRSTMGDFLHPTAEGYRRWAEAVEPWMKVNVKSATP